MNWYIVKLTYRIICGNGKHTPQFDEQLRLISATDEASALFKARKIGESGSQVFFNENNQLVQWQFINISELNCINDWSDGAEVHSTITEADNADAYINLLTDKAAMLDGRYLS